MLPKKLQYPPPAGGADKKKKGGHKQWFTPEEVDLLLDAVERHMPIGQEKWMCVVRDFNNSVPPDRHHDKTGIQNKFNNLWKVKKPTGDPTMPDDVRRAKHINYKIMAKSQLSAMGGAAKEKDTSLDTVPVSAPSLSPMTDDCSINTRKSNPPNTGRKHKKRKGSSNSEERETDLLKVFLETERLNAERQERRDRCREKREDQRMQLFMKTLTDVASSFAAAIGGKKRKSSTSVSQRMDLEFSSSSDEESSSNSSEKLSSVSLNDRAPTKKKKEEYFATKKNRNNNKK
jgi:hypothetical protein